MLRTFVKPMSRYASLSRDQLVAKLEALDLAPETAEAGPSKPNAYRKVKKAPKAFNFASHPTRHVALLVAYHGWPYSGLAIQAEEDGVPTVEAELLQALERTRLIEPGKGWEGCGFSRCGRTDRGVSGTGQVLSLWVRSNRKEPCFGWKASVEAPPTPKVDEQGRPMSQTLPGEYTYPRLLNNVLPPSIRVLGWSPIEPDFDARFSCKLRHYKYAFHLDPTPSTPHLDLDRMTAGAQLLVGEHDFRNFCKLDGSKQIESHSRRVISASFDSDEAYPGMVVFNLVGTAFLWHQVRHIIGVLFLIGSKLEEPSLVSSLLDTATNPSKPTYQMGHPLPLTLYECGFESLDWRVGSYDGQTKVLAEEDEAAEMEARVKLERGLEELRQEAELRAWQVGNAVTKVKALYGSSTMVDKASLYPTGGGEMCSTATYRQVMTRPRGELPEDVNRKWREKNGKPDGWHLGKKDAE